MSALTIIDDGPVDSATHRALMALRSAHDALAGMSDSDLDWFEDEEEEIEAVPAQYAARKVMEAIELLDAAMTHAYAEGRKDEAAVGWQPIETAPEDENILVATQGGYVDTAFWTDEDGEGRKWWWLESANKFAPHPINHNLMPTHWMPLPKHPSAS